MAKIEKPKRILLKLSGETLLGDQPFGIDPEKTRQLASTLKAISTEGFQLALVIGGGNIFRGIHLKAMGLQRSPADQMGMLATLMNGIAIQQALNSIECPAKVMSALECPDVAENYNWQRANESLISGEIMIFVGGTGNPYFTTDTAAALRGCEIHADLLLKATKVDGVYSQDPLKYPKAKKYSTLTYSQYLAEKLEVMDASAIALCMNNHLPIFVFNMQMLGKESLKKILSKPDNGTLIS
jgi:uridylate kinase